MGRKKLIQTEEEKKAKALEYYYKNKEKYVQRGKEFRAKNKGYYTEYFRNNEEQREKRKAYMKEYNSKYKKENKAKTKAYDKLYNAKRKDGLHYVYLLKDEHYIGVTDDIVNRFWKHKHDGRNTDNYRIMFSSPDRQEAEKVEKQYHGMGFFGA